MFRYTSPGVGYLDDRYVNIIGDIMTGPLVITPTANGLSIFRVNQADGTVVFNVDTTNAMVGINVASPVQALDVDGNIGMTGSAFIGNTVAAGQRIYFLTATENNPITIGTTAAAGTWFIGSGATQFNVGMGIIAPTARLHIVGSRDSQQLIVQANATQTVNIVEIQKSDNSVLAGFDERGILFSDGGIDVNSVFIGGNAGRIAASGAIRNVGIGYNVLDALSSGDNNVGIGYLALSDLNEGNHNVAIGSNAGANITDAVGCVAIGSDALFTNIEGNGNFALGSASLYLATSTYNVAIGQQTGRYLTIGGHNVYIGRSAGNQNVEGVGNVFIGYQAGKSSTGSSHSYNVAMGYNSAWGITTGGSNVFLGAYSGDKQTTNSNLLIIDNQTRTDVATELTNSILYGVMAAIPANQSLRINAAVTTDGFVRKVAADYRRYYHLDLASFDPGASGATWTSADANTVGGWQLNAAGEILESKVDIHADWDGASDPTLELRFQINTASAENDTVDIKVVAYYMGFAETGTKTQTVEVATNVGDGGAKAQYTMFTVALPLNWDEVDNVIEVGDCIAFQINLETDTSEVDDIIVNAITYHYNTTHLGIESGDT